MARFYISRRSLKHPGPRTVIRYIHYTYTYAVFIASTRYPLSNGFIIIYVYVYVYQVGGGGSRYQLSEPFLRHKIPPPPHPFIAVFYKLLHFTTEHSCARCCSSYVGSTHKHSTTRRIEEHLGCESSSIFKHLRRNPECHTYDQKVNSKFWITIAPSMSSP